MARPGGNPDLKGKKGRSGRKSVSEEVINKAKERLYKDIFKQVIPAELLAEKHLELINAKKKIRYIGKDGDSVLEQEEIDLNSVSKGLDMAYKLRGDYAPEKIDHTTKGESIVDNTKIKELTDILNEVYRGRSQSSDGVAADSMDNEICDKE